MVIYDIRLLELQIPDFTLITFSIITHYNLEGKKEII